MNLNEFEPLWSAGEATATTALCDGYSGLSQSGVAPCTRTAAADARLPIGGQVSQR